MKTRYFGLMLFLAFSLCVARSSEAQIHRAPKKVMQKRAPAKLPQKIAPEKLPQLQEFEGKYRYLRTSEFNTFVVSAFHDASIFEENPTFCLRKC